jgi:hypothetical protein
MSVENLQQSLKKLQADPLQKLRAALAAAVELRVITYVGQVTVQGELTSDVNTLRVAFPSPSTSERIFLTSVNLVQGDIVNVIPPNFGGDTDNAMLAFHAEQVKEGKEIVARNLEMIAKLGKQLASFARG